VNVSHSTISSVRSSPMLMKVWFVSC